MKYKYRFLASLLIACSFPSVAVSKCGNAQLTVRGRIIGGLDGVVVSAQVYPEAASGVQPTVSVDPTGRFRIDLYFDRTNTTREKEECSRKPVMVQVQLRRAGEVVDGSKLQIARDFIREKNGDYATRSSVTLHSRE